LCISFPRGFRRLAGRAVFLAIKLMSQGSGGKLRMRDAP
jgi:hypothetical protein